MKRFASVAILAVACGLVLCGGQAEAQRRQGGQNAAQKQQQLPAQKQMQPAGNNQNAAAVRPANPQPQQALGFPGFNLTPELLRMLLGEIDRRDDRRDDRHHNHNHRQNQRRGGR
jgi:hypothetical protein